MGFLSKSFRLRLARLGMSAGLAMTVACQALANPEGPTVRHGQVNISPGTHAQIQQLTDRAIVDWNSFSVGRNESLVFLQPSQLSVILNRVTGGDPSAILGQLSANGNVFLINPNGILFGPDSVVNVGGLVASTLNLNDDDFLSGNYRFFDDSSGNLGAVVNQGRITISDGGYAVLTGPAVLNEGLIVAKGGKVVLASGERATLNLDGRDLVHFSLESSIGEGNVLLAPGALSETLANALGVNPALRADRLVQEADGSVRMVRSSGTLVQAGTVSVDGNDGIDAGSIILDSTDVTILADGSVTSASGVGADSGGGEILVLSDMDGERSFGFTDVHTGALISATGGASGDAGFIEVSGNRLNLHGEVDLTAPNGVAGTFLLDPQTYTIIDGDNMPTTVGDFITVGDQYFNTLTGTTLVISSTGDVIFDLGIDGNNPTNDGVMSFLNLSGNRVNLTINSGTDPDPDGIIDFGDDGITVSGLNSMNLNSEGGVLFGDSRVVVNGNVNIDSVGAIQLQTGTLLVTNDGDITLDGENGVDLGSGFINPGAGGGSTGFLHILSDRDIDLGTSSITVNANNEINPLSITAGDPLDLLAIPADLILGGAQISVVQTGGASGVQGLILTATRDIDFGSSDLTYSHNRSSSGTYEDRISAGGNIFSSAAPDGDPGNFLNNYVITGDTGPLLMTAGGSIVLTDLFLDVNEVDVNVFRDTTIAANGGVLDLGNSEIDIETALTLSSSSDIIFNSPTLTTYNGGNLDIDAGGYVSVVEGTLSSLGHLHITGDHGVSLGDSTLTVNSTGPINPLSITAGDAMSPPADLLLGNAQMTVTTVGGASGVQGLFLTATGDIDLGSSDLTYSHDRSGGGIYQDRINAGGSIFSSVAPDGNPNTFVNNYSVTGDSGEFTMTAGTDILLPDMRLVVDEFEGQTQNVVLTAEAGQMFLGESEIVALDGDVRLQASGLLDLDSSRLTTVDQLVLSSNTAVSANGSGFTAPDIEVFGFDPMTMVPGGAVNGDVELDLAITTLVDLTVLATGNVDITNTGGGTIRADAIGGVGLSSTNGDVSVVTDGNLASGSGTDVFAANTVNLVAANIGIGSPFQVEGSKVALDTSSDAGSVMNVEVLGTTTSFLSVAGNDSVIDVREVNSGGLLEVNANILDLPLLGIEEILVSNVNGLTLDSLVIGPDQSVGIKALGGDITATSNNSVNLSGALALEASGDVGENLLPITVAGGTLAIDSGGQVFVEGTGPALTIGTVLFDQDPSVPQKSVAGISATDDIVVVLTGSGPTQLVQEADIATTGGNVALVAVEGGLVQTSGVVRGGDVVLKADGNVGEYDGTNVLSEFGVEAERLILDIGGDAIVDQQTGDLTIAQQATVGGNLFTATGAGGDLRVRNSGGDLTLEADLDSGGEAALLTGDNLTVTQGGLANSVFLNGSLTAADSLVVISAGDISQTSGVLTAPKIGLGAVGQIGSPSQPINVVTDEMALNPLNAQVSDPDGFTPVASVSAAGATVNQQTLPPPPPDPVVPPEPVIPPVIPPSAFEPPADFLPNEDFVAEAFSANNTEMVEEVFAILEMLDEPLVEEDPSRVPILWPEDEDFMQKKFRR